MVQAPQSLGVSSANVECIRPGMPLSQNMNTGKDKHLCFIDVSEADVDSPPVCRPVLPHVSADILITVSIFSI